MSLPKVGAIGGCILLAFILNVVSVFTDGWVYSSVKVGAAKVSSSIGIVPYHSDRASWFNAASWMMFIALALFFVLILLYLYSGWLTHHNGCSHEIRHFFHGVGGLSVLIAILQVIAFIIVACKAPSLTISSVNSSVGYSGYLALVSSLVLIAAASLSGHVSYHDCH